MSDTDDYSGSEDESMDEVPASTHTDSLTHPRFHPDHSDVLHVGTTGRRRSDVWASISTRENVDGGIFKGYYTILYNNSMQVISEARVKIIWHDELKYDKFSGPNKTKEPKPLVTKKQKQRRHIYDIIYAEMKRQAREEGRHIKADPGTWTAEKVTTKDIEYDRKRHRKGRRNWTTEKHPDRSRDVAHLRRDPSPLSAMMPLPDGYARGLYTSEVAPVARA